MRPYRSVALAESSRRKWKAGREKGRVTPLAGNRRSGQCVIETFEERIVVTIRFGKTPCLDPLYADFARAR